MLEQKLYKIAKVMNIIEWKLSSLHLDTLNKILRYETTDIDPPLKLKKNPTNSGRKYQNIGIIKVALGVCFALKFMERRFTSFSINNYLM